MCDKMLCGHQVVNKAICEITTCGVDFGTESKHDFLVWLNVFLNRNLHMLRRLLAMACLLSMHMTVWSQCAVCTKTASTLGDKAAKGLNGGIIYLALMPLIFMGFLGYRWYKSNKESI